MKRLISSIKYDILFQYRQGFYLAYGFVTLFYLILLKILPINIANLILPFILFTDVSVLGFFFVGGIILLEKQQNSLDALMVTPLTVFEYLMSKFVSLSIIATLTTVILFLSISKNVSFLPALLMIVWTNMFFYTFLGIGLVSKVKSVNDYFVLAVPAGLILFLPMLTYFDIIKFPIFYLLPTEPAVEMLNQKITFPAVLILSFWMIVGGRVGYSLFVKNIVRKGV